MTEAKMDIIDAVVTWVDGNDPQHASKLEAELAAKRNLSLRNPPAGHSKSRYANNDEIRHCLHGIRRFMPWIRNIYIVTDQQVPDFLDAAKLNSLGIAIVDHQTIFRGHQWALPTFNSRSIETVLHRIPGLAERYIYLNDDVIPVGPSAPSDFFVGSKVVVRGKWTSFRSYGKWRIFVSAIGLRLLSLFSNKPRSAHLLAQMRAATLAGFSGRYFHSAHTPHAVRTETLRSFFRKNEALLRGNIRHRFRNLDQFVAHPLAHHLEAARDNCIEHDGRDCVTINFAKGDDAKSALSHINDDHPKFVCVQGLELATPHDREMVLEFLGRRTASYQ